jgi:predicted P-loop ATPase
MGGDWFSDSLMTMEGKTAMEQVGSGWIIEMAELGGIKRSEVEQVKAFLSKQEDNFRPAYGEVVEHRPRQCVFCGTTNEISFLKGDKGNRRFWVIPVSGVKKKYEDAPERLQENRDQLWAEAYHYYKNGEKLYLDRRMELEARKVQEEYNDDRDDPVKDMLSQFLEQKLPVDWNTWDLPRRRAYYKGGDPLDAEATERRDVMCIPEFVCEMMGMERKDKDYKYVARKVGRYMEEREGWERSVTSRHAEKLYGRQLAFKRIVENDEDEDL